MIKVSKYMKKFNPDFFSTENFIISKKIYQYAKDMDGYHISYNVNDTFIPIMGASIVSVREQSGCADYVPYFYGWIQ